MNISRILKSFAVMAVAFVWGTGICFCQITAGQPPPDFTLQDIEGKDHHLASLKSKAMSILYFFDVESRPSQEGLLYLNKMIRQYSDADLVIWGITLSDKEKISRFARDLKVDIPLLQDTSGVSDLYQARLILPSVCILGPGLTVLDYFQGGGKTTEIMLVRLAERQLQRKNTLFAKALSEEVEKKDPENVQAKTVKGYAALQGGEYDKAEEVFQALSQQDNKGKILGKEGLAAVYAKIGKTEKALEIARQVEQEAP
ncbi:MAG: redoxin domain-containing protein, partial [Desulfobacterales bacterium]